MASTKRVDISNKIPTRVFERFIVPNIVNLSNIDPRRLKIDADQ